MLAVGTRFAEICTGSYGAIPPEKLIHIDINPDVIGANHPAPRARAAPVRLSRGRRGGSGGQARSVARALARRSRSRRSIA